MATTGEISIATHPQHMVGRRRPAFYRSLDGGATWQIAESIQGRHGRVRRRRLHPPVPRLPAGAVLLERCGRYVGAAAGVFGQIQTTALGYADADGHTILYAATNGGSAATTGGTRTVAPRSARAAATTLVGAGVYRYVALSAPKLTLKLGGLRSGALRLGRRLTVDRQGDTLQPGRQQAEAQRAAQEGSRVGHGHDRPADHQHQRRLQLEIQAGQARQLPRAGLNRQDDQDRGRRDDVAHVQGEVARQKGQARIQSPDGSPRGSSLALRCP